MCTGFIWFRILQVTTRLHKGQRISLLTEHTVSFQGLCFMVSVGLSVSYNTLFINLFNVISNRKASLLSHGGNMPTPNKI